MKTANQSRQRREIISRRAGCHRPGVAALIVRHQSQLLGIVKHRMCFLFLSLLLVPSLTTMAAAQTNDVSTQLKNVVDKIRAKRVAWKTPEAELAPELEELDAIYLQHKGENPEDLANVLRFKATVYWSVVDNSEKGIAVIRQIKKD